MRALILIKMEVEGKFSLLEIYPHLLFLSLCYSPARSSDSREVKAAGLVLLSAHYRRALRLKKLLPECFELSGKMGLVS